LRFLVCFKPQFRRGSPWTLGRIERVRRKPIIKILVALLAAFFGFAFCYSTQWPHYRTIEVSPGVFVESWMPSRDFWFSIAFGLVLFAASGYLLWHAYRESRRDAA
jgi:hypothetical protein